MADAPLARNHRAYPSINYNTTAHHRRQQVPFLGADRELTPNIQTSYEMLKSYEP